MQPAYYEDFNEIKKKIWSMLDDAVTNRSSHFRIPVFICGDQKDFDGRIVVLRKSDQKNNLVQFHSDFRSDKIGKLKKNAKAAMLFYDKEEKIQVRLQVECAVNHDNEITKESWSKTQHISRKCYLVHNGPGTVSDNPTSGLKPEIDITIVEQTADGQRFNRGALLNVGFLESEGEGEVTRGVSLNTANSMEQDSVYDCSWSLLWNHQLGIKISLITEAHSFRTYEIKVASKKTKKRIRISYPAKDADIKDADISAYVLESMAIHS